MEAFKETPEKQNKRVTERVNERANGKPDTIVQTPDSPLGPAPIQWTELTRPYTFTVQERLFFERLQNNFNNAVMTAIQMICTQNELPGNWRIRQDGTGLEPAS